MTNNATSHKKTAITPLAHRMRPEALEEFFGQSHLLGENSSLRQVMAGGALHSMIFWGPPGTGKTTLAMMLAKQHRAEFVSLSAVSSGVKDIRNVVALATDLKQHSQKQTILFLDEVHRFNKSQQDAFLPYIEDGTIIFVGATTENPSFALNNALLSRARVYVLKALSAADISKVLERAISQNDAAKQESDTLPLALSQNQLDALAASADGDARKALGLLELISTAADAGDGTVPDSLIDDAIGGQMRRFDKGGDEFYDQISALHKSVRGSNPDAALYWLCRMLDGGCDPRYLLRRVVRMASEDVGNADPRALWVTMDCQAAYERLGSPEGDLAIAQAVVYLACAPKSNAVYTAFNRAMADVRAGGSPPVPDHLRNAPTKLAKELGHGEGYQYAHDYPGAFVPGANYFPDDITAQRYYHPVSRGLEINIAEKLNELRKLDNAAKSRKP